MYLIFRPKGFKALLCRGRNLAFLLLFLALFFISLFLFTEPASAQKLISFVAQTYDSLCESRPPVLPASELSWLAIPDDPNQLSTRIPFVTLAGILIDRGVVNADTCPDGGLLFNGAANSCGLDRALDLVYSMQNLYDDEIINAWELTGVPPALLKQIFRYESQFWPGQFDEVHFGLGHLTAFGASTAMFWSPQLYQDACYSTFGQACLDPYQPTRNPRIEPLVQTVLGFVNAECSNCETGIDVPKAEASVLVFAETVHSYCRQTEQLLFNLTNTNPGEKTNYVDLWKFTLFDYNAGAGCFYDAASMALDTGLAALTWENLQPFIIDDCQPGVDYVERITQPFYDFSN